MCIRWRKTPAYIKCHETRRGGKSNRSESSPTLCFIRTVWCLYFTQWYSRWSQMKVYPAVTTISPAQQTWSADQTTCNQTTCFQLKNSQLKQGYSVLWKCFTQNHPTVLTLWATGLFLLKWKNLCSSRWMKESWAGTMKSVLGFFFPRQPKMISWVDINWCKLCVWAYFN